MIPRDKIVVVTGDPRSGTSLMMQTLRLLRVPVAGEEMPVLGRLQQRIDSLAHGAEKETAMAEMNRREAQMQQLNPKGFFEVSGVVVQGTREIGRFGGKALKIISPGAYPRQSARGEIGTPPEIVCKYVLCLRDPTSVAHSQAHLDGPVKVPGASGWENPSRPP